MKGKGQREKGKTGELTVRQVCQVSKHRLSDVRRGCRARPPFIFIDAADEEPQDHDYHTQQSNGGGEREHAGAERWIEKCQPA